MSVAPGGQALLNEGMTPAVLITGAAKRIGAAIARRFAAAGWRPLIHFGTAEAEARALAAELGGGILRADLADTESLRAALEAIGAEPGWSAVVNNASVFDYDSAAAPSRAVWLKAEAVNLWAAITISETFCRAREGRAGAIVNLLDQKLVNLNPDFFSYTLSKAALEAASRMLALEHAPHIRIVNVAPGITLPSGSQTETEFAAVAERNLLKRMTTPQDIADAVHFAATARLSSGQTLHVDGGQRFLPLGQDVMFTTRAKR